MEMSNKELERIKILSKVRDGKLTQVIAAKILNLSDRQIRNLLRQIEQYGDKAIVSKKRNKPSNRCLPKETRGKVLNIVRSEYNDFGPTLANEYLQKEHQIHISTETLRSWMVECHLWVPRNTANKKLHPPRKRRRLFGELIQVDGSHHDWFEGRSPHCVLMVFIDDATSEITSLHFSEEESLEAYYRTLEKHLRFYGVPVSIYGDKCAVLASRNPKHKDDTTQFQKALKELNCELILANSPQAKGRVERANRTLQDRLVKELRLREIKTIKEANEMIEEFREKYNKHFSKRPSEQMDAHRPLDGTSLDKILCIRDTRTLSKDRTVQFENNFYQISLQAEKVHLFKGAKIEIRQCLNGEIVAMCSGVVVSMTHLSEVPSPILSEKQVLSWKPKRQYVPPKTHPYKHKCFIEGLKENMFRYVV